MPRYRYLGYCHAQHILNKTTPELRPGEARLYSYYRPSLQGVQHTVTVKQSLEAEGTAPKDTPDIDPETQKFTVVAPQ
jgi:hypothetical protein